MVTTRAPVLRVYSISPSASSRRTASRTGIGLQPTSREEIVYAPDKVAETLLLSRAPAC